jgi:hypothetical protein
MIAANIVISNQPNPNSNREFMTSLQYTCPQRLHYFDFPVGNNFVSYYYTKNINSINVTCTKEGYVCH